MALEFDIELCTGCRTCEMVCAYEHFHVFNPKKAAIRIRETKKKDLKFEENIDKGDVEVHRNKLNLYQADYCNQCGVCVDVCPVDAISMEDGVIQVDEEKCTKCYLCKKECPQNAIFAYNDWYPIMCDQCGACVEECPVDALALYEE